MAAGEFELIARYLAPLAADQPGADMLRNDTARLDIPAGRSLIVTTDTMIEGRHFLPGDPPDTVARKLLRVNLSDLAAAGAEPWCYQLAAALRLPVDEDWFAGFCAGLAADQREFGIGLTGGDTTGTEGPATFTVTAFGLGEPDRILNRGDARSGDLVCVTGVIGEGLIGLKAARGELDLDLDTDARDALVARYRVPEPRVAIGRLLPGRASAAVDVSDGLIADLGHICEASDVGAELRAADVPLSDVARRLLDTRTLTLEELLAGGDDYELVFTVRGATVLDEIRAAADVPVSVIGEIMSGDNVTVRDAAGGVLDVRARGWTHF